MQQDNKCRQYIACDLARTEWVIEEAAVWKNNNTFCTPHKSTAQTTGRQSNKRNEHRLKRLALMGGGGGAR